MLNTRIFSLVFLLIVSATAAALPPRYSITKLVGRNSFDDPNDIKKIEQYAHGWAEALMTTEGLNLFEAQRHLIEPLEIDVAISPYARQLYGKALKEGFEPILHEDNTNEMAAVNALQVVSLLGTEQGCRLLLNHADFSTERRTALRLWGSVGLGKSFKTGVLPARRVSSIANLLADFASREPVWYIISRQFRSLADLQSVPDLDSRQQDELETLSLKLQIRALSELINDIEKSNEADDRVRSLPFILSSLRLQLIEPGINDGARAGADTAIVPLLIQFSEIALQHAVSSKETEGLHTAYGEAMQATSYIADRVLKTKPGDEPILGVWVSDSYPAIRERVELWKKSQ